MLERILKPLYTNCEIEKAGDIWKYCNSQITKIKFTEDNLNNMCINSLTYGYFTGHDNSLDKLTLIKLDHALGLNGISNPEGSAHIPPIYPKTNCETQSDSDILRNIEHALGFSLKFPEFTGGIITTLSDFGIFSIRHLHYLWVAKRILELCPDRNSAIIEIGPGIGILGYYLDQLGYKDYTIIDLAYQNACQAYYLWKNLPHREFILSGEVEDPFSNEYKESIKILHSTDFDNTSMGRYDLMVNIDGLTEYSIEDAKRYIHSDCAPLLLSINHEVNLFRVIEIAEPFKHLVYRFPFWLREGYVEELYKS